MAVAGLRASGEQQVWGAPVLPGPERGRDVIDIEYEYYHERLCMLTYHVVWESEAATCEAAHNVHGRLRDVYDGLPEL